MLSKAKNALYRRLYAIAFPSFDCTDCIGAGCGYSVGCWCAYHNCVAPGEWPEWWRAYLQKALARRCKYQ